MQKYDFVWFLFSKTHCSILCKCHCWILVSQISDEYTILCYTNLGNKYRPLSNIHCPEYTSVYMMPFAMIMGILQSLKHKVFD